MKPTAAAGPLTDRWHAPAGTLGRVDWALAQGVTLPVYMSGFDTAAFDLSDFARAGIACPATVGRAVPKRQAEFLHGRLCARAALRALGIDHVPPIGAQREPQWPAHIIGSITHGAHMAAATAIAQGVRYRGVGIDIEDLVCMEELEAVCSLALSGCEQALLHRLVPRMGFDQLATLVFSAKESFYKALYPTVLRFFDFSALALEHVDFERQLLHFRVTESLCPEWPSGRRCDIDFAQPNAGCMATAFLW